MRPVTTTKAIAWTLATIFTPLLLNFVLSSFYLGPWYARTGHQGPPPPEVLVRSMMIAAPAALWLTTGLWWFVHRRAIAFAELFGTRGASVWNDLAIGIALGVFWIGVYGVADVVAFGEMFVLDGAKLASVPMSLSAGVCEEFLFRGFLIGLIARAGGGRPAQLIYSSLAFGLGHCLWGPWGMLWTVVLGITFGLAVLWRGNVWPAVVAHTVLNLCIEPALVDKAVSGGFE